MALPKRAKLFSSLFVSNKEDDECLMAKVKGSGDSLAFKALYDRYKGPILSYVKQTLRNNSLADETAQEVFLKIYRERHRYDTEKRFSPWIWTIAKNTTKDVLKKKKEVYLEDMNYSEENKESPTEQIKSPYQETEKLVFEKAQKQEIENCLSLVPPFQRQALMMRIMSDLSYEEIAKVMEKNIAGIKSLIHRARQSLAQCLKEGEAV